MSLGDGTQPITYFVELLSFVQDRIRRHGYTAFMKAQGERTSDGLT
jgi:hypothetical protein